MNLIVNGPGASACNVTLSFVLQPGHRYEAQMTSLVDRCIARIVEPGFQHQRALVGVAAELDLPAADAHAFGAPRFERRQFGEQRRGAR